MSKKRKSQCLKQHYQRMLRNLKPLAEGLGITVEEVIAKICV